MQCIIMDKAMSGGPLHKSCQPCPWSPNWPHPGCHYLPLIINGKKTQNHEARSLYIIIYQFLVIPCINLANHALEVQIGHVLGSFVPIDSY